MAKSMSNRLVWIDFKRACPRCSMQIGRNLRVCNHCGLFIKNYQGRVYAK